MVSHRYPDYGFGYVDDSTTDTSSADVEFVRYEAYLRRELPSSVRIEIEQSIDEIVDWEEEKLRSELPRIIHELQLRLFQQYQQHRGRASTSEFHAQSEEARVESERSDTVLGVDSSTHGGIHPHNVEHSSADDYNFPFGFDGAIYDMLPNWPLSLDSAY